VEVFVDRRLQNMSLTKVSGIDFEGTFDFDTRAGAIELGLSGTYLLDYAEAVTPDAADNDVLDTAFHPIDLKLRGSIAWNRGAWSASAFIDYVDGFTNNTVTPPAEVDSWTTVDLQLAYDAPWLQGVRFSLSALNAFDQDPPFMTSPLAIFDVGFDPTNASALGRFASFAVTARW
jgi:hypothetical protein